MEAERSLNICNNPGEVMVQFQAKPKGRRKPVYQLEDRKREKILP